MAIIITLGVLAIIYAFAQAITAKGRRGEDGLLVPLIAFLVVAALLGATLGPEIALFLIGISVILFLIWR